MRDNASADDDVTGGGLRGVHNELESLRRCAQWNNQQGRIFPWCVGGVGVQPADILRMFCRRVVVASTAVDVSDRVCDAHIDHIARRWRPGVVDMHRKITLPILDVERERVAGNRRRAAQRDTCCALPRDACFCSAGSHDLAPDQ